MTYQLKVNDLTIKITKLDTDEYEFTTTFKYLDYYGKSFMKLLSFIDDFDGYLKNTTFTIDHFDKHLILCCSVPYSNKCELVQLNKPEASEYEELSIMIKQQDDIIRDLNRRLSIYEEKTNIPTLDLVYERDTWYFDTASYMRKPGANMANVEFLMNVLNDRLKAHAVQSGDIHLVGLDNVDAILAKMNDPIMCGQTPGCNMYISPYTLSILSLVHNEHVPGQPIIESTNVFANLGVLLGWSIIPTSRYANHANMQPRPDGFLNQRGYPCQHIVHQHDQGIVNLNLDAIYLVEAGANPMNSLMDTFKLEKLAVVKFEIPRETIQYKRIPKILNKNTFEQNTPLFKSELNKMIEKYGYPSKKIYMPDMGKCSSTYIIY